MKYKTVINLEEGFRRLTGVKRTTFNRMAQILREANKAKKKKGGRNNKLCIEGMLLMALEYLREYRTYFHISQSYGVSESTGYKVVKWIEDSLIKRPDFALPGLKALLFGEEEKTYVKKPVGGRQKDPQDYLYSLL